MRELVDQSGDQVIPNFPYQVAIEMQCGKVVEKVWPPIEVAWSKKDVALSLLLPVTSFLVERAHECLGGNP